MKIFFDADMYLLVNLSIICGEGVCLLKRFEVVNKSLINAYDEECLERIFVNLYSDQTDLIEFLGNFHLIQIKPKFLFVDLNIAKKKEVFSIIALLASLQEFADIHVYCIMDSNGSHLDIWVTFGRFFDRIFIILNRLIGEIVCEKGITTIDTLGDLSYLRKLVK